MTSPIVTETDPPGRSNCGEPLAVLNQVRLAHVRHPISQVVCNESIVVVESSVWHCIPCMFPSPSGLDDQLADPARRSVHAQPLVDRPLPGLGLRRLARGQHASVRLAEDRGHPPLARQATAQRRPAGRLPARPQALPDHRDQLAGEHRQAQVARAARGPAVVDRARSQCAPEGAEDGLQVGPRHAGAPQPLGVPADAAGTQAVDPGMGCPAALQRLPLPGHRRRVAAPVVGLHVDRAVRGGGRMADLQPSYPLPDLRQAPGRALARRTFVQRLQGRLETLAGALDARPLLLGAPLRRTVQACRAVSVGLGAGQRPGAAREAAGVQRQARGCRSAAPSKQVLVGSWSVTVGRRSNRPMARCRAFRPIVSKSQPSGSPKALRWRSQCHAARAEAGAAMRPTRLPRTAARCGPDRPSGSSRGGRRSCRMVHTATCSTLTERGRTRFRQPMSAPSAGAAGSTGGGGGRRPAPAGRRCAGPRPRPPDSRPRARGAAGERGSARRGRTLEPQQTELTRRWVKWGSWPLARGRVGGWRTNRLRWEQALGRESGNCKLPWHCIVGFREIGHCKPTTCGAKTPNSAKNATRLVNLG